MTRRGAIIRLAWAVTAVVGWGCGSQEGPAGPVAASITAGSTEDQAASTNPGQLPTRPASDPLHPAVEIETSHGTITVELDGENSPGTVSNFINYVQSGFYDQTIFHYVDPKMMAVAGGFTPQYEAKPLPGAAPIRNEAHNGLKNTRGTIAMSRDLDVIDSATSQFFINLADNAQLDYRSDTAEGYGYCVFGRVTSGMDVVDKIAAVPTHDQGDFVSTPQQPVVIQSVRQIR